MAGSLDERFAARTLDPSRWVPHYLAHWSSRAESEATFAVEPGSLRLSIPVDQGLWCAETHPEPLRVSCIQSGARSGPVGSTDGPQPFRPGLTVREQQPLHRGYLPTYGRFAIRMRAELSRASMFAFYLSGFADRPERAGEICVAEIFGHEIADGIARVGAGIKRLGDPDLDDDFMTVPLAIDVAEFHEYGADWTPDGVRFTIDGQEFRRVPGSPDYPMQLMIGVFDFPDRHPGDGPAHVPTMWVERVLGSPWR